MLAIERKRQIYNILLEKGSVMVSDLSKTLNVSEETVRRDIERMADNKNIIRTRGGAYFRTGIEKEAPLELREFSIPEEKQYIAEKAFGLIEDSDVLFIDASTTAYHIARVLAENDKKVTVITDSLNIAGQLWKKDHIGLVMIGGNVGKRTGSSTGFAASEQLSVLHADKAFISCYAIHPKHGLVDGNELLAKNRKIMLSNSTTGIVIADSTKFGRTAPYKISPLGELDYVITEKNPGADWSDIFAQHDIKLIF